MGARRAGARWPCTKYRDQARASSQVSAAPHRHASRGTLDWRGGVARLSCCDCTLGAATARAPLARAYAAGAGRGTRPDEGMDRSMSEAGEGIRKAALMLSSLNEGDRSWI